MSSRPACKAFVFDAYGTLFDVQSLASCAERAAPRQGDPLVKLWRAKQLEYSWLTSLMERGDDFGRVTEAALDYALAALMIRLEPQPRRELLDAWLTLPAYPDAAQALRRLAPAPRWILSNGSRAMLGPLVANSGLDGLLDGTLSVDEVGIFKPSPRVYALASSRLALAPREVGFVSANGWDATGAKARGFTTFWINRNVLPVERHGPEPDYVVASLADVAAIATAG